MGNLLMGNLLMGICILGASFLFLGGVYAFVHDCLLLMGPAKSFGGDGPFGLIAGPVYAGLGGWLVWKAIKIRPATKMK